MSGREAILARIRQGLNRIEGDASAPARERAETVERYLGTQVEGLNTTHNGDLVARFTRCAIQLASTVEKVAAHAEVAAAVARYLAKHKLPRNGICWPAFADLDWAAQGLDMQARATSGTDLVGLTGAFCAIAETGTLMLLSGPNTPAATSLLPETHIAVLPLARIVASMEQGWELLRREPGAMPRAVNFISGPSRTADIEQTVTLGAHGPYRVHIILVA